MCVRSFLLWILATVLVIGGLWYRSPPSDQNDSVSILFLRRIGGDPVTLTAAQTTVVRNVAVVNIEGRSGMAQLLSSYNKEGNLFCERIDAMRSKDDGVFIQFNITFGCYDLFAKAGCGTGNFLQLLYGMRLAAEVYGDVSLHFTCFDAEEMRTQLILPWLTGFYPARPRHIPSAFPNLTLPEACGGANRQPVGYMVHAMRQDFRYMAYHLVGRPKAGEDAPYGHASSPSFIPQLSKVIKSAPPYANMTMDEAVIHFRCGDLMDSDHRSFAFMTFRGYTRRIPPNVTSIGILTQSLTAAEENASSVQVRSKDAAPIVRDRCRTVVHSLVDYIQKRFPRATVRIHDTDPIALTYARMVLAPQHVMVGLSTFGAPPALATLGTAYLRVPDAGTHEVNQWLRLPPHVDTLLPNVVMTHDPKRPVEQIQRLWDQEGEAGVLAWFWNDTWTGDDVVQEDDGI